MSLVIDLSGKVALVTGASQGIGAQVAPTFHAAGETLVLNTRDWIPPLGTQKQSPRN